MYQYGFFDECFVDSFAGGGGASTGIEMATGHPVDVAINHNEAAIMMHRRNHPFTEHYIEDIWQVDPKTAVRGRHVRLAWFSPDCKHFSRAKGAALVDKKIRGLAWVVLKWAAEVRPDVIMLENVPEFVTWGPVRKGKPIKSKAGQTYKKWLSQLEALGYKVETKKICAADHGAPTIRTRFHLIARCDGRPIVFPERSHAPRDSDEVKVGKLKAWRSAAEIIDFSLPCPSIFASKTEIKEQYGINAMRPLKENTLRRIARGLDKFVIKSAEPFIVPVGYGENKGQKPRIHDINEPLSTVVSSTKQYVCDPLMTPYHMHNHSNASGTDMNAPVNTVTGVGAQMVVEPVATPYIVCNNAGNAPHDISDPVPTVTTGGRNILAAPTLIQYHTEQSAKEVRGQKLDEPIQTVDAANRYGVSAAWLTQYFGGEGHYHSTEKPLATITTMEREGVTSAFLSKFFTGVDGAELNEPTPTVTAVDHNSIVLSHLAHFKGKDKGQHPAEPLMTITSKEAFADMRTTVVKWDGQTELGYWNEVRKMLNEYCGYNIADDEILLLNIRGCWYFISDIGLRMLTPRELYDAMGFPHDYIIDKDVDGKPITRADQVARCGNAVCPAVAEALVRANLPECCKVRIEDMEQLHQIMTG
ncbi:MAG: DNA cytosine methyltransferase [Clostridia bacterium]|nr:DNA cytosine methyltransferase [Clostridia bacterium]